MAQKTSEQQQEKIQDGIGYCRQPELNFQTILWSENLQVMASFTTSIPNVMGIIPARQVHAHNRS